MRKVSASDRGVRVLRAEDSLLHRQQVGVLVPGGGRSPACPVKRARLRAGDEGVRVFRAEDSLAQGQQVGELVPGGGRVPRPPGPEGEARAGRGRVSGCSGPRTRSSTGSRSANWSRAAARSPACPVKRARLARAARGSRVFRAEDSLLHRQQLCALVPGGGRVPRLPGQAGEVGAGDQGIRVFRAEDSLAQGQQVGELVPGGGQVPRVPGPEGEARAGRPGSPGAPGRGPVPVRQEFCAGDPGPRRNCRSIRGNGQFESSRRCHRQEPPGHAAAAPRIWARSRAARYHRGSRPQSGRQRPPATPQPAPLASDPQ